MAWTKQSKRQTNTRRQCDQVGAVDRRSALPATGIAAAAGTVAAIAFDHGAIGRLLVDDVIAHAGIRGATLSAIGTRSRPECYVRTVVEGAAALAEGDHLQRCALAVRRSQAGGERQSICAQGTVTRLIPKVWRQSIVEVGHVLPETNIDDDIRPRVV